MTTPRPSIEPRAGVLIPFIFLFDSNDEVTTLPVRPAPPSPNYVPALPDYSPDSDLDFDPSEDDLLDEDLTKTVESLHTQTVFDIRDPVAIIIFTTTITLAIIILTTTNTFAIIISYHEGEPRYEIGESSSAQIHPITGEPIHRTIPLLVAKRARYDGQIKEIRNHQREISVVRSESEERIKTLEKEVETLRGRVEDSEARLQQCKDDM
ncbi:hypothetical protein Tco_1148667 [Tanacetum coccineum]